MSLAAINTGRNVALMEKWNELAKARMKALKITQDVLAEKLGVTQGAVAHWLGGRREPDLDTINKVLAIVGLPSLSVGESKGDLGTGSQGERQDFHLSPISVWDDDTPLDDDEVEVPFLREVELSAGSGKTVIEQSSRMKLRFGKYTLRRKGVDPANAVAVPVKGNSMEPVLPDGSTVGVDRGATSIVDGKMYAVNDGGLLRVKTLYRLPGGRVRLRSYNRDEYEDEERGLDEITVIGRVFWYSVLL